MIAPSRKHLEDWIVDNHDFVYYMDIIEEDGKPCAVHPLVKKVIKRKTKLPSGFCDLVTIVEGYGGVSVAATKLEWDSIDHHTVTQCLCSMRDLRETFVNVRHPGIDSPLYMGLNYRSPGLCDQVVGNEPEVTGLIVGYKLSDQNLIAACEAADIVLLTYEYTKSGYNFDRLSDVDYKGRAEIYRNFAYGAIGEAMREIVKDRYEREQRHTKRFSW